MLPTLLLALLPFQDSQAPGASASSNRLDVEGFRHSGDLPVGRVYRYRKSNVDGSNPSHVDLYVASPTRIESFKYHVGYPEGTLVVAEMDWETFSVSRFETTKVYPDGTSKPVAELEVKGNTIHGKVGPNRFQLEVEFFPWHSYDFDLASLNVSLRHLAEPEETVWLGMIDVVQGRLACKGMVELAYLGEEDRRDERCRRYGIDGPGLDDRGGDLWVRMGDDPVIVEYEIDLPDEPGMVSGKLSLLGSETMDAEAWGKHRTNKLQ